MLLLEFVGVAAIVFACIATLWRRSPQQVAVDKRFREIRSKRTVETAAGEGAAEWLKAADEPRSRWSESLLRSGLYKRLQTLSMQADVSMAIDKVLAMCAFCGIAAAFAVYGFLHHAALAAVAVVVGCGAPLLLFGVKRKRRVAAFEKALPEAIDMLARSLRAGHALPAALGLLAEYAAEPAASEFAEVFRKQNFGVPLRDGLLALVERVPSADVRVVVTGMLVQKDTGGNLAEVLARVAAVLRDRQRIQGEVRTHTAQGRITGWILCAMPPVLLLVINIANPGYSHVLVAEPAGRKLLMLSAALLVLGAFSIRHIVNGIEV